MTFEELLGLVLEKSLFVVMNRAMTSFWRESVMYALTIIFLPHDCTHGPAAHRFP